MTRVYAENAEKEPAYLPQTTALVNRESRGVKTARAAGFRVWISARLLAEEAASLRTRAATEYGPFMRLTRLREQLSRYRPLDATEAGFVARMAGLTDVATACARSHFEPGHFTASAFVLSPDRRELILIHHKKLGLWLQPGGHVDAGDADLESAARREVGEEVGLGELEPLTARGELFDIDIHAIPAHKQEPKHEHFDVRFAFVAKTRAFLVSDEVAGVRWVGLREADGVTGDRSVLRAVEKLRALLT